MHGSLTLSIGTLLGFLLVLARVSGALAFVPMPGVSAAPGPVKIVFALAVTFTLFSQWPKIDASTVTASTLAAWAAADATVGIAIGVSAVIVMEAFTLAAQVLGLQAGYAYAQTVDPNTQADSGILLVLAQLVGGMLFFAVGLDRQILRLFALSLERIPAGTYIFGRASAETLIQLASNLFSVGVRLALPVVALLVMVDVALALLGRLNSQLQLLSLAFPAKMLIALLVLSWIAVLFPRILRELAAQSWAGTARMLGI
ncbi:MAG TPA: flagellar biosynthetic protein FliR [Candidatus Sulfopaludibacter sp.]|jgi:flagellar biosynthetic protein FliR|nr:flagellar biosynthetic protein FliR [Candidatus Sulfopaludibacter sp.]